MTVYVCVHLKLLEMCHENFIKFVGSYEKFRSWELAS
jgi:hypothetical protein